MRSSQRFRLSPPPFAAKAPAKPGLPKIVLEGLPERLFEMPIPPGRISDLVADGKRLWWREAEGQAPGALRTLALEPGAVPDTPSERVLQQIAASTPVRKIEVVRPTLEDVFIGIVAGSAKTPEERAELLALMRASGVKPSTDASGD
jgi:tricorn protease